MHPATIREPARDLRVAESADVVVAGGGVAGIAAAVAAARSGASVLLLERTCTPGGLATAGNVAIYLPICDGRGRQVLGGLAEELLRLSVADLRREVPAAGFFREPAAWRDPAATPGERAKGGRFQTGFDPAAFSLALEALLLREGVRILYDTRVCAIARAIARDGAAISHLVVENKSGRAAVACRAVVDATGDADVCFLAGERTESLATNVPACWYYAATAAGGGAGGSGESPVRLRYLSNPYDKDAGTGGGAAGPFFRGDDAAGLTAQLLASRDRVRADLAKLRAERPEADVQPFALPSAYQQLLLYACMVRCFFICHLDNLRFAVPAQALCILLHCICKIFFLDFPYTEHCDLHMFFLSVPIQVQPFSNTNSSLIP